MPDIINFEVIYRNREIEAGMREEIAGNREVPEVGFPPTIGLDEIEDGIDFAKTLQDSNEFLTFTFYEASIASGAGKGVPKTIVVDRACVIEKIYVQVETAPGAGKTLTIDVNKNGTTIFTTQGNRPSITGANTTDESGTPDVTALAKNNLLTMDIDVSDGSPATLSVYVRCRKSLQI